MTVEKDQLLLPKLGRLPVLEGGGKDMTIQTQHVLEQKIKILQNGNPHQVMLYTINFYNSSNII